jgi:hypothetical protein
LINANVHLFGFGARLSALLRYAGCYEDLIVEAAQVALKNGLTTVFDTYGPRRHLMAVRDRIHTGAVQGSRFFCAGNIVGFDGPLSADFHAKAADVVGPAFAHRINSMWVENVGRHLMWLTPKQVGQEVSRYIARGIDFIKYGSNEHYNASAGAFLAFSTRVQAAIVEAAHNAGITAQAHSMSVEGLHAAVEAGCDLVTHCNITGPIPIPDETLELMARRQTGAVIFPWTDRGLAWIRNTVSEFEWALWRSTDINARKLIKSGAPLLLANDGVIFDGEALTDPRFRTTWAAAPQEESLVRLDTGHIVWMKAMEEKGCAPMQMLQAATRNIAVAYGKDKSLGTLEKGKLADMVILDKDPLQRAENYSSVHMVIKDGSIVDRDSLPEKRIMTRPMDPPTEEEASYIPAIDAGPRLPNCPLCMCH